jgi:hypothetical protein
MNLNISLIKKIESIINLTTEFDNIFKKFIQSNSEFKIVDTEKILYLTRLYIFIRSEHGSLLILNKKLVDLIKFADTNLSEQLINKLCDVSTFASITQSISNLISNIDHQFKRIAIMYPNYINKNPTNIILFTDTIDKNNKYIKIIEEVKNKNPENIYKVIQVNELLPQKINCGKILNKTISIKVTSTPSIYIINDTIIETNISSIHSADVLSKLIE